MQWKSMERAAFFKRSRKSTGKSHIFCRTEKVLYEKIKEKSVQKIFEKTKWKAIFRLSAQNQYACKFFIYRDMKIH